MVRKGEGKKEKLTEIGRRIRTTSGGLHVDKARSVGKKI
jgi:hypothetical protein